MKVQEEQAEKERLRREAEDEVVKKHIAEIKRKLDELDRMKRGDALDMLNREIEQKRLGCVPLLVERYLLKVERIVHDAYDRWEKR